MSALVEEGGVVDDAPLPRSVTFVALPLGCLLLVVLFSIAIFPYERFGDALVTRLAPALGAEEVQVGALGGGLSIGGPALRATDLQLRWPDGTELRLDEARLRPAWSFSWFRLQPALHVEAAGPPGRLAGTLWPGEAPAFDGHAESLDVGWIGRLGVPLDLPLDGRVDADVDLALALGAPRGEVDFEARDGSVSLPGFPIAVPYESLVGGLGFAEDGRIDIEDVSMEGPMVALTASGSVGPGTPLPQAPLDLQVQLVVRDPSLRTPLSAQGVRLDGEGRTEIRLAGSLVRPVIR